MPGLIRIKKHDQWALKLCILVGTARVGHAHMVLRGHRSIVNQVRYNKSSALIISSGVEKVIKVSEIFTMSLRSEFIQELTSWVELIAYFGHVDQQTLKPGDD